MNSNNFTRGNNFMGYTIFEISKELNINTGTITNEIQKDDFEEYVYQEKGIICLKEEGIQKLLGKIDAKEIEFKSSIEYEREISLLKMELLQTKKELEERNLEIKVLEKKVNELSVVEKRVVEVEEKVILNMRTNLVKRSERNKRKRWF